MLGLWLHIILFPTEVGAALRLSCVALGPSVTSLAAAAGGRH